MHRRYLAPIQGDSTSGESTISAEVNRLSGYVPGLTSFAEANVLDGNLFTCGYEPAQDPNKSLYICGSSSFDYAMKVWGFFAGCAFLVLVVVMCVSRIGMNYT